VVPSPFTAARPGRLAAILSLWLFPCLALAQGAVPAGNHFLCYEGRTAEPRTVRIEVRDEASASSRRTVDVGQPTGYCDPASDVHRSNRFEVVDEEHHLVVYEVTALESPFADAVVTSAFSNGDELVRLERARWLMAPTRQLFPNRLGAPRRLDHYLCYGAQETEDASAFDRGEAELEDQFGRWPGTSVGRVLAVCNPVEVRVGRRVTPVRNATTSMACYDVNRSFAGRAEGTSSLGEEVVSLTRAFALCVPATVRAP
jgi:hypothetical protein